MENQSVETQEKVEKKKPQQATQTAHVTASREDIEAAKKRMNAHLVKDNPSRRFRMVA